MGKLKAEEEREGLKLQKLEAWIVSVTKSGNSG